MRSATWLISGIDWELMEIVVERSWGFYVNGAMDQSIYWYFEPDSMK